MTDGPWRVIVDSWVGQDADWYGRREWVVVGDCNDLRTVLHRLADSPAEILLDEDRLMLHGGRAPVVDVIFCGDYPAPCNCDDPVTHGGH